MELTDNVAKRYKDGQLVIQNRVENYVFRGEIETAEVKDGTFVVRFKWLAKLINGEWIAQVDLDYSVSLLFVNVTDLKYGRVHYEVAFVWENCTLFPPNGSKLDRNKVKGLAA